MFGRKIWIAIIAVTAAVLIALAIVLIALLKAPSTEPTSAPASSTEPINEPVSSAVDVLTQMPDNAVTFTSTVYNLIGKSPLVSVNGGLCRVSTRVQSDEPVPNMAIGDVIEVVYDGRIAESYPGQINFVYAIRLVDGEHSPLTYTFTPKPSAQKNKTPLVNDIYYYGLDGMDVTVDGITMDLQQALRVGLVSSEYLLTQAQRDAAAGKATLVEYKDGGSKLYRYPNYAFLKMNSIAGDKSLYIGTTDLSIMTLNESQKNDDEPLLKITVSQSKQNKPIRVSTWRTAKKTDYIMYFVDVDSVQVKTDEGYQDIPDAVDSGKVDMNTLRSKLMDIAQENGSQAQVIFGDGLLDGTAYTQTTMRFADFTVTFTGHQSRREVFFSPPNTGGFTQGVEERIAEESPKYPLAVVKNDDPMARKITKAAWKLDYDVYYSGIDRATVTVDGKSMDLIQAIDSGALTFDELVADAARLEKNALIFTETIKDGGSKRYHFNGYTILKKHQMNGDRSLYIIG